MSNFEYSDAVIRQVANELERYVYMLVDPRDGIPFYIGKGRGDRFASHGVSAMLEAEKHDAEPGAHEANEISEKNKRLRKLDFKPEIWIVRYGMKSDVEYTAVEAACIDAFRSLPITPLTGEGPRLPHSVPNQLTNARLEAARGHGLVRLTDLLDAKAAPPLEYPDALLLITLKPWVEHRESVPGGKYRDGYGYKSEWLVSEERMKHLEDIGLSACSWWKLSKKRVEGIKYAVALHGGITRGLYEIIPETIEESTTSPGRIGWQFKVVESGDDFDAIVGPYGHRIEQRLEQNRRYWPF